MFGLFYVLLAILLLSFLIFIHELGHYIVARRVGMRVDAFGIGFGKPIYSWMRDGVEWRIGWLPFGGYVKISGLEEEKEDGTLPPDSFFARPPIDRIKVALAGPLANLLMAFLIFTLLWAMGGRLKNFSEVTPRIGWVDPQSRLYSEGIRPGDEVLSYDGHPYKGVKDHTIAPMTSGDQISIEGYSYHLQQGEKQPFSLTVPVYKHPLDPQGRLKTSGVLSPASYLIYKPSSQELETGLSSGSPLLKSGIQPGDRIVWADGELLYSNRQLEELINDGRVLLTVQRENKRILRRVPRVRVQDLKVDQDYREELVDWQFAADLQKTKLQKLFTIPYNLTNDLVVENEVRSIDRPSSKSVEPIDAPLEVGDKILAIGGTSVKEGSQLLKLLQEPRITLIVLRDGTHLNTDSTWVQAQAELMGDISLEDLNRLVSKIGSEKAVKSLGRLYLLDPVIPKLHSEFNLTKENRENFLTKLRTLKAEFESIEDPDEKAVKLQFLNESQKNLQVSPPYLSDRKVTFNPTPFQQFSDVFHEIYQTLYALISGNLNPKWLAGPVGIVQIVKENWSSSFKEGLYWVGAISLNLGILNLLPIPVLDGGTICFSLFEMLTGRRLSKKTMERLVFVFAMCLIGLFVFITYQDIMRIFGKYLSWL